MTCVQAQAKLDSLVALMDTAIQDSMKARLYVEISQQYRYFDEDAVTVAAQEAITYYKQVLLTDKTSSQFGHVHYQLGMMYALLKEEATALHHFQQAGGQFEGARNQFGEIKAFIGMANAYRNLGDLDQAFTNAQQSLQLADDIRKQELLAQAYDCLGRVLLAQKKESDAYTALRQALRLYELTHQYLELVDLLHTLSFVKQTSQDWEKAMEFAQAAEALAQKIGYVFGRLGAYQHLAKIYGAQKEFKRAYQQQEKYFTLKDSIAQKKALRHIEKQQGSYTDQQKVAAYEQLKKQQAQQATTLHEASNRQFYLIGSLLLSVVAVLILAWYKYRQNSTLQRLKRQNEEVAKQNEQLEKENSELQLLQNQMENQHHSTEHHNLELVHLNHDLADRNQRITDNITYAKRVQHAVLPMRFTLKKYFTDVSLIYLPKDIVSGDFYWLSATEQYTYFALADGTGHGVSGAFMSLLGSSFLDEIVNARNILAPKDILNQLHDKFIKKFQQGPDLDRDGLELAFCRFEEVGNNEVKMVFSGARENVYYCLPNQSEVHVLEGARKGIGGRFQRGNQLFDQEEISLPKETLVYFFTDGLPDHPKLNGRRLGTRNILHFIERHALLDIHTQTELIKTILERYKRKIQQRDDISFVILKL